VIRDRTRQPSEIRTRPASDGQAREHRDRRRQGPGQPAKAVERLRVEAARTALENGAASVQRVALDCGFGDVERMRRSFMRLLGVAPSSLRRSLAMQA